MRAAVERAALDATRGGGPLRRMPAMYEIAGAFLSATSLVNNPLPRLKAIFEQFNAGVKKVGHRVSSQDLGSAAHHPPRATVFIEQR
jgi:hypothetical protein